MEKNSVHMFKYDFKPDKLTEDMRNSTLATDKDRDDFARYLAEVEGIISNAESDKRESFTETESILLRGFVDKLFELRRSVSDNVYLRYVKYKEQLKDNPRAADCEEVRRNERKIDAIMDKRVMFSNDHFILEALDKRVMELIKHFVRIKDTCDKYFS